MKKLILTALFLITVIVLTACGGNDTSQEDSSKQSNTNAETQEVMNSTSMDDMKEKMEELAYTEIDFDVLYSESEFEGEIEDDDGLIEAEFYDPVNNVNERGPAAFDSMFPLVQSLEVTHDMSDEEAIAASIQSFNLPDNFLKAELQITFKDGTEKAFEVKNNEM